MADTFTIGGSLRLGLSRSEMLDFQLQRALAYEAYGGASIGEVLAVVASFRKRGGSRDAWVDTWRRRIAPPPAR